MKAGSIRTNKLAIKQVSEVSFRLILSQKSKPSFFTISKNRGQRDEVLEKEFQREDQGEGEVPLVLSGFIILPLLLGLPSDKQRERSTKVTIFLIVKQE